jgi:hypothetical protein
VSIRRKSQRTGRKAQREHQYFGVVITYTNGETSANKVFKGTVKVGEFAVGQEASPVMKSATLKPFMRDAYNAPKIRKSRARPSSGLMFL